MTVNVKLFITSSKKVYYDASDPFKPTTGLLKVFRVIVPQEPYKESKSLWIKRGFYRKKTHLHI